ncbi:DUF2785 domain-containing protein [Planococcus shixiaomingii]|uniref:DUF2785 domain-containing protein n=1 Tax=Planococcus shixiaomingii TaxID=3058393 RepID=UPI00261D50F0|nr:DUF2785 domain-containing protein [Planococcus sp. N022]WKA56628.1 DUF2785 domain-containing protein [Planococcus sp. N022]
MNLHLNSAPLNEQHLKKVLKEIQSGEQVWTKENELLLIPSMVEYIGSTDAELRDQLIYSMFLKVIVEKQLEPPLLSNLLDACLSENLLYKGIGEKESDSVFTRSFTTLLIALILYRDNEDHFLSEMKVSEVKEHLIAYINRENDLRGFVSGKGWAHSIAHVADSFEELIKNKQLGHAFYRDILHALWNKALVSDSVYLHDEEERILIPLVELLHNGLGIQEIEDLINNIPMELKKKKELLGEENYWFLYANCKKFLKSFYIKLNQHPTYSTLQKSLEDCLSEI